MLIRERLQNDAKTSLKQREKSKLSAIRLIISEQRRIEIDTRSELNDEQMLTVLEKMCKQRLDSIEQFEKGGRQDLIDIEQEELSVIQSYLPEPLDEAAITALITEAISANGAHQPSDMGKVMAWLKPKVTGRADMKELSGQVKTALSS